MKTPLTLLGALLIGASLLAQQPGVQTTTPKREKRMEQRAERQQKRIAAGVKSGQLTPKEAAKLEKREAKIDRDIKKAEADGKITKKEAAKIEHGQDRASRKIAKEKHDKQGRK